MNKILVRTDPLFLRDKLKSEIDEYLVACPPKSFPIASVTYAFSGIQFSAATESPAPVSVIASCLGHLNR